MNASVLAAKIKDPNDTASVLDHHLKQYFPELLKFESTPEMETSELYRKIKPEVDRILNAVVVSGPNDHLGQVQPLANAGGSDCVSALAWNIERGNRFEGILDALQNHPKLKQKDLLLLKTLPDCGAVLSFFSFRTT